MSEVRLALTPALSPKERENVLARFVKSHLLVACAMFLG